MIATGFLCPGAVLAQGPHDGLTEYEGSKSCAPCHAQQVNEVFGSAHYKWRGPTPEVPNLGRAGKLGGINDFCIYPNINFILEFTNLARQRVVTGCSACHAGMGKRPSQQVSQDQLDNIDCLMCHLDSYRRVGVNDNGDLRYIPDPTLNLPAILPNIHLPTTASCLTRCHTNAGGGPAVKQGDIDPVQLNPPRNLDVHMSPQGAGLTCLDCHTARNHRIAGRGNDIRETDLEANVDCSRCHGATPHLSQDVNRHTDRVHCTTCHIPKYAVNTPTETHRDFTRSEQELSTLRYEPVRVHKSNLDPVYRWFNGQSFFYKFGANINLQANNTFLMAGPLGNIRDPQAKIHAFKYHTANMAYEPQGMRLIPLKSRILWQTGNMDLAIRQGAAAVGFPLTTYNFAKSRRYFSLYHMVPPKENALMCGDCHGASATRMNFAALGYTPRETRNGLPLCSSCHSPENAGFYEVHQEHVQEMQMPCNVCHFF